VPSGTDMENHAKDSDQRTSDRNWGSVRFGDLRVETSADHRVFEVEIFLNDLCQNAGRV